MTGHTKSLHFLTLAVTLAVLAAAPAAADQCILDDLIVDGSQCIGFDCVCNGENFGFDTLRLKENNLRIHFQDTSVIPNFPSNDWRIIINDSANGGANYFAIEDASAGRQSFRVEAGARSNALYVESDGDIGIGTSNPSVDVHIVTGDTPTLRLEQDNSSGFTPQTWDLAGNETNFFVRDVTNGSALPFRIQPGTASNTLFLANDEQVGIKTSSPDADLDVNGQLLVNRDNGSPTPLGDLHIFRDGTATASLVMQNSATRWQFNATNTAGGQLEFFDGISSTTPFKIQEGVPSNFFTISAAGGGQVQINGAPVHPDYVFEPDYELASIEEHAAYMWEKRHLPAVGAGQYGGDGRARLDLVGRAQAVLEELEIAHVYIAQLNERLEARTAELAELERASARESGRKAEIIRQLDARMAGLEDRLRELEAAGR